MNIPGIEGLTKDEISFELQRGGRFVRYLYCISIIVLTFKRSKVHFIKAGESPFAKAWGYALLSLLAGWWGIPWGPIYTVQALVTDLRGGEDITAQVWTVRQPHQASTATGGA